MALENKWLIKRCDDSADQYVVNLGDFSGATEGTVISIGQYCYSLIERGSGDFKTPVFDIYANCLECFNKQSATVSFVSCNGESDNILMSSSGLKFVPNLSDVYDVNILVGDKRESKIITGCYTYNGYSSDPLPPIKISQNGEFKSFNSCDDCVGPYIKDLEAWASKLKSKAAESKQSYLNLVSEK